MGALTFHNPMGHHGLLQGHFFTAQNKWKYVTPLVRTEPAIPLFDRSETVFSVTGGAMLLDYGLFHELRME
jgi:hypothetical protein